MHTEGAQPHRSCYVCPLFCDALDLPQGTYLDFSRPREWETAAGRYRTLFAAYAIQPQDILLRHQNQRLYIAPHVQQYLVGLDAECEEQLTRWTLGVRSALEAGDALPSQQRWQRHRRERTGRRRTTLYTRDQLNKEALLGVQQRGVMPREAGVHLPAPTAGGH